MKMIVYTVNDRGLDEIAAFLAAKHKLGGAHFDRDMLRAWAKDAEFQLSEGNEATIDIQPWAAVSGHTETYTISAGGLGCVTIEGPAP